MTSREAFRHTCRPGYWLRNIAPLGEPPDWREEVQPQRDMGRLFGYDRDEFMAKQYREGPRPANNAKARKTA